MACAHKLRRKAAITIVEQLEPRRLLAASLVSDIHPSPASGSPDSFATMDGITYFSARDSLHGEELWRTDGTVSGTWMVCDIRPGINSSDPRFVTVVGDTLYFLADNGASGIVVWKSDGTAAGTQILKNINAVNQSFFAHNGTLYFIGINGTNGQELWKSDGTTTGTVMLKDVRPGSASSIIREFTSVGDALYFTADDGSNGRELWKTDGTSDGTQIVDYVRPGEKGSEAGGLAKVGDQLYFVATEDGFSYRLWITDGTEAGTRIVGYSGGGNVVDLNGVAYYRESPRLYRTEGTYQTVAEVFDYRSVPGATDLGAPLVSSNHMYFWVRTSTSTLLYKSDGTTSGTVPVQQTPVFSNTDTLFGFTAHLPGGRLLFSVVRAAGQLEIWSTDGSDAGTQMVRSMQPPTVSLDKPIAVNGGIALFHSTDAATGAELWKTDGTPGGTQVVKDIIPATMDSMPTELIVREDGSVIFSARGLNGWKPWVTNGTPETTSQLMNVPANTFGAPTDFANLNGQTLFITTASVTQLWKTSGTVDSTALVKQLGQGQIPGQNVSVVAGGIYYVLVRPTSTTMELWRSDGTTDGTYGLKTFANTTNYSARLAAVGSTVYFMAPISGSTDLELWKSDGTPQGTILVKDVNLGAGSSNPSYLTAVGGTLFFSADDGVNGTELWKTDGSEEGTVMVRNLHPTVPTPGISAPSNLMVHQGVLYFSADDGAGLKLWRSDGTSAGTVPLTDAMVNRPQPLGSVGHILLFSGDDPAHGTELWRTDGTAEGTRRLKDIYAGVGSSFPAGAAIFFGGALYFNALDGLAGPELWRSDGTTEGTVLANDTMPGPDGRFVLAMGASQTHLFFRADDGIAGVELWRIADQTAPGLIEFAFDPPNTVRLAFSENVAETLLKENLQIAYLASGQVFSATSMRYDPVTNIAKFEFDQPLPNGDYRATLNAGAIGDSVDNLMDGQRTLDFFVLKGDLNRDRSVSFIDLITVAAKFGSTSARYADGDIDGDGQVGFADLIGVAASFGTSVSAPSTPMAAAIGKFDGKSVIKTPFATKPVARAPKKRPLQTKG